MFKTLQTLAQAGTDLGSFDYNTSYTTSTSTASAGLAVGLIVGMLVVGLLVYLIFGFVLMKVFKKAGRQDAWAAFVPFYNMYVYYEIAGRPGWWAFLALIPFVGGMAALVTGIIGSIDLAKSFGKDTGFGILLILLPFIGLPMLAFGDATYQGPAGPEGGNNVPPANPTNPIPPVQPPVPPTQPPIVQ
jgi:hypothetical protein